MVCLLWLQTGFPTCPTTAWASSWWMLVMTCDWETAEETPGPRKIYIIHQSQLNSGLSSKKGTIENINKYCAKKTHGYPPLPNHSYFNTSHSKQECHFQFKPFLDSPLHLLSRVVFLPSTNCMWSQYTVFVDSINIHFHMEWAKWLMQEKLLPPEDSGRNIHLDLKEIKPSWFTNIICHHQ